MIKYKIMSITPTFASDTKIYTFFVDKMIDCVLINNTYTSVIPT